MKKLLFSSLFAACAAIGLSSCMNGDYDATPTTNNGTANPLNPSGGSGGGGGGGSAGTAASYYSWAGTDPLSVKADGALVQATGTSVLDASGTTLVQSSGASQSVQVAFPSGSAPGTIIQLSSSSPAFVTVGGYTSALGSGGIYIIENDATHCKGKFFGVVKQLSGSSTKTLTEGYFNASK